MLTSTFSVHKFLVRKQLSSFSGKTFAQKGKAYQPSLFYVLNLWSINAFRLISCRGIKHPSGLSHDDQLDNYYQEGFSRNL